MEEEPRGYRRKLGVRMEASAVPGLPHSEVVPRGVDGDTEAQTESLAQSPPEHGSLCLAALLCLLAPAVPGLGKRILKVGACEAE